MQVKCFANVLGLLLCLDAARKCQHAKHDDGHLSEPPGMKGRTVTLAVPTLLICMP